MRDEPENATGDDEETPLREVVSGAVIALTFVIGFGLMFAGYPFFWVAFPVGFAGVLPMALGLVKLYERRQSSKENEPTASDTEDALEALRQRYARGEFSDEEFERRLEHLLETDSLTDAQRYTERVSARRSRKTRAGERVREQRRDREQERLREQGRERTREFEPESETEFD